jgi:argininosuccinate lyase
VVRVLKAHLVMLVKQGLIGQDAGARCLEALRQVPSDLPLDPALEDVHMNLEAYVAERVGKEVGGQLNLGKSRNDQVAAALRMVVRDYLIREVFALCQLRSTLLDRAAEHLNSAMPGYTHLQPGQPTTLAHHLLAHHDALARDTGRLIEAYGRINLSPMGACALAGTTLPIDRELVARLLGFQGLVENSMDAVSSRDFALEVGSHMALTLLDLSRLAEELVLWSSPEFGFVELPDEYSSTSSIMPQKKNPVVPELVRAKAATALGHLVALYTLVKALPLTYNLDLQEGNGHLHSLLKAALESTKIMVPVIQGARFNTDKMASALDSGLTATDLADYLTLSYGIPFRQAHQLVSRLAAEADKAGKPLHEVAKSRLQGLLETALGRRVDIRWPRVLEVLNPVRSVSARRLVGGPSPEAVAEAIHHRRSLLEQDLSWAKGAQEALKEADHRLQGEVVKIIGGEKRG